MEVEWRELQRRRRKGTGRFGPAGDGQLCLLEGQTAISRRNLLLNIRSFFLLSAPLVLLSALLLPSPLSTALQAPINPLENPPEPPCFESSSASLR